MLKLCFFIEFQKNNKGNLPKVLVILKMFLKYIALIGFFFGAFNTTYGMLQQEGYLSFFASINVAFLIIFHGLLQLYFFKTLEKDVVISFLPDKTYNYIRVRLFMIIIRWSLVFILPSMFFLKKLASINSVYFYMDLTVMVVIEIIINYLIAIYLRYMLNIKSNSLLKKLVIALNTIFSVILFMVTTQVCLIELLDSVGKEKNITTYIYVNNYFHLLVLVMLIIVILLLNLTNDFFKTNSRKLIINMKNVKQNNSIKVEKILNCFIKNNSLIDKTLIIKDVKGILRDFSYGHLFFFLIQMTIVASVAYFYVCTDVPKNLKEAIIIMSIFSVIIFVNTLIVVAAGGLIFKNKLKIHEDNDLLRLYNIKHDKKQLIKIKRWTAYLILSVPMYVIYIIALVCKSNIWAIITSVSLVITSILLGKVVVLVAIKIINKDYSDNTLIQAVGLVMYIGIVCVISQMMLNLEEEKRGLVLYCIYNLMLLASYFYDSKININAVEGKKKCLI